MNSTLSWFNQIRKEHDKFYWTGSRQLYCFYSTAVPPIWRHLGLQATIKALFKAKARTAPWSGTLFILPNEFSPQSKLIFHMQTRLDFLTKWHTYNNVGIRLYWARSQFIVTRVAEVGYFLKKAFRHECYLLALLAHYFLHVSRIRVKSLAVRLLMSYIYIYIYIYI